MIVKITRGGDGRGLVRYLFGKGEHNEHQDQRVVAVGEGMDVPLGVPLTRAQVADLGYQLEGPHLIHGTEVSYQRGVQLDDGTQGKEVADGHIWHLSLSNKAGDRVLSDQEWAEVARSTVERMGFTATESRAGCPWVAIRHGLSAVGNDHMHLAVDLVRDDGSKASVWKDMFTMSQVAHDMEVQYGLTVIDGRGGAGMPGQTRAELEIGARQADAGRGALALKVREAAVTASSEADFVRTLRQGGVLAVPRYEKGGQGAVTGYSVALKPAGDERPRWFAGGKLAGRDLALPALRGHWQRTPETATEAVSEWSGEARAARAKAAWDEKLWGQAARRVHLAVRELKDTPVTDTAAWRGAARETSGALAALSRRAETQMPTQAAPLAHASAMLARSAQVHRGEPPAARSGPVRDMRDVAGVVAQAAIRRETVAGWILLAAELVRMVEAIQAAHLARGERFQAEALATGARAELQVLERQLRQIDGERRRLGPEVVRGVAVDQVVLPPDGRDGGVGR